MDARCRIIKRIRASNCEDTSESVAARIRPSRREAPYEIVRCRSRSSREDDHTDKIYSNDRWLNILPTRGRFARLNEGGTAAGHKARACMQVKQRPGNRPTDRSIRGTGRGIRGETRGNLSRAGRQISDCEIRYANWEILIGGCADPFLARTHRQRHAAAVFVNPRTVHQYLPLTFSHRVEISYNIFLLSNYRCYRKEIKVTWACGIIFE